jgi:hypothetical protein
VAENLPGYRLSKAVLFDLALACIFNRRRAFPEHARRLLPGLRPPLRVLGKENIPCAGPAVIVVNHYWSPTFWAPWLAIAISAVVPREIYWTMTGAFTYPGRVFSGPRKWLSRALLAQVARVYRFNTMPPMPPAPGEVVLRAQAVRRLLDHARRNSSVLIGLAPEGYDRPGGVLGLPPEGAGRLALALSRMGRMFSPAGVYEESGGFCLCFGAPFRLEVTAGGSSKETDLAARLTITREIARCLPPRLRGEF